jgi:hypothetical protein
MLHFTYSPAALIATASNQTAAVPVGVASWVYPSIAVVQGQVLDVPVGSASWSYPAIHANVAVLPNAFDTPSQPIAYVELELNGSGAGWTDVLRDVIIDEWISIRHGIDGSGPADLVARTGTAAFVLNNSASNSAGLLGYYSLYHANKRSGWGLGIGCRIRLQDPTTSVIYTRFIGRIDVINPAPGAHGDRRVSVTATDWMDEAARWTLTPDIGEQIGQRGDQILSAIVAQIPRQPEDTDLDMGTESYPYALDTSGNTGQSALAEFGKLAASEFGLIYVKADGTLRYEGRHSRLLDTTDDWTITDADLQDLSLPSTRDEIINTVRVTTHPRVLDPILGQPPTLLVYDQANVIAIAAGETKLLLGSFRDPVTGDPIGATEVQDQVAGTDYLANASQDGSGADVTSDLDVVLSIGQAGVSFSITNHNANTVYLTRNQLRGRGIFDHGTQQFEASDAPSVAATGEHAVAFDMPYQVDDDVGQGAADYLLAKYSPTFAQARVIAVTAREAVGLAQILTRDISDRLAIAETVSGLNSSFFINGEVLDVLPSGHLRATYTLAPAADPRAGLYWILGTAILGTDTVPAPF